MDFEPNLKSELEILASEISPEEVENFRSLTSLLDEMSTSLRTGSIKEIYGRILDEKKGSVPSTVLLDDLKNQLMGEVIFFYTKLEHLAAKNFSVKATNFLKNKYSIDLPGLPEKLLSDITSFMKSGPQDTPEKNDFRLSVWIETIVSLKNIIENILKYHA